MIKKVKRFMALFLLLALVAGSILASCAGPDGDAKKDGGDRETSQSQTGEDEPGAQQLPPAFEMSDYKGQTFLIAWPELSLNDAYYFSEELNGDQLNDAVYARLKAVEEQLNLKITEECIGICNDVLPLLKKTVAAGLKAHDLVLTHTAVDLGAIASQNLVHDWNKVQSIDPSGTYWNRDINQTMNIRGKQPYISNAFNIAEFMAILFNKQMIKDYSLEDPYELVKANKWTIDKMTEMARQAVKDLDGDGKFDKSDQYGFAAPLDWHMKSFNIGFNQPLVEKDENGIMQYVFMTERMGVIVEKMHRLLYEGNTSFTWPYATYQGGIVVPMFDEGRVLFMLQWMAFAEHYREANVEYGILPHPKLDEAQQNYRAFNSAGYSAIPLIVEDTELVGKVVELLGYWGYYSVIPAYKNVLLTQKVSRDYESADMLDIIFSNLQIDLANSYGYMEQICDLMQAKSTDLASYYEKNIKKWQTALDKNNAAFADFGQQ